MVLKKLIRTFTGTVMFLAFIFCFSCEEVEPMIINCIDCFTNEPVEAEIKIKLEEINSTELKIINIYDGNLEDNLLIKTQETTANQTVAIVKLNKTYTVTARYHIDGNFYMVVNSVTPRIKYDKEQCDAPCYYVYDRTVNMKVKYTK